MSEEIPKETTKIFRLSRKTCVIYRFILGTKKVIQLKSGLKLPQNLLGPTTVNQPKVRVNAPERQIFHFFHANRQNYHENNRTVRRGQKLWQTVELKKSLTPFSTSSLSKYVYFPLCF